jgi:hypothetical protein
LNIGVYPITNQIAAPHDSEPTRLNKIGGGSTDPYKRGIGVDLRGI